VSLEIHRQSLCFPVIEQRVLGDQLRRASKSICANVAEGYGRQKRSKAEFKRFLQMAIGSSDEIRVWVAMRSISATSTKPSGDDGVTNIR
jgi:four helix bundle protein